MKTKQSKVTRRITMALSAIMLSEQLAGTGAVLYAHAEDEIKTEYKMEHSVTSSWDGGCNANIILTNLADRDTQDWSITFSTTDKITNFWGGTITECLELKTAEEESETVDLEEADDKFDDIFESAFKDEFEDDIFADFSDEFEEEVGEYIETSDEENEVENTVEVSENATENVTSEEIDVVEPTVVEAETDDETTEAAEATEEVIVETQEYDFDAPAAEEYEVYYQYTVKALDYNAVIKAGESVTIGYMAEGNNHDIWDENAVITLKEADKAASIPVGGTYEYDDYTVEVKIPAYWDGAYNVQLLITNTSDKTIHNWAFVMETANTIFGLYNAVEVSGNDSEEDNVHLIKNAGHNQDIPVGGTVELGYTAYYEDDVDVPDDFALSQIEREITTAECEVSLLVSNEWGNGGLAEIIIKNISELPIEDWMIEFDSALDIKEIWGGVIEIHEGEHYFIRNSDYAQNILQGESWTVGILFSGEAADIRNVEVRQIVVNNDSMIVKKDIDDSSIVVLDTSMASEKVGRMFYKDIVSDDDIVSSSEGLLCVRDQILITIKGKSYDEVEELVKGYDARIVGCIELTGNYQIEFNCSMTAEELDTIITDIETKPYIETVGLNYIWLEEGNFASSDPWYENVTEWKSNRDADGTNWGIEAINLASALVEAGVISDLTATCNDVNISALSSTPIGIIDSAFDESHEDLDITDSWMGYEEKEDHAKLVRRYNGIMYGDETVAHGTQTLGVIGATFNNGIGISGVSIKHDLYAVALNETDIEWKKTLQNKPSRYDNHVFKVQCALGTLITVAGAKVINYSLGHDGMALAMSQGDSTAEDEHERYVKYHLYMLTQSNLIANYLNDLLDEGYDYLIVTSAGNANNKKFIYYSPLDANDTKELNANIKSVDSSYSGATIGAKNSNATNIVCNEIDAKYNNAFTCISSSWKCYDHIICVGSIDNRGGGKYSVSDYSNRGNRVDILAPGSAYTTTIMGVGTCINYEASEGTSIAAPFVTGAIGLAYSVNPGMSASDMKKAVIDSARNEYLGTNVLDVASLIRRVNPAANTNSGNVSIHVKDENGNPVPYADVLILGMDGADYAAMDYDYKGSASWESAADYKTTNIMTQTDEKGEVICEVPEGGYFILVAQGNLRSGLSMIGWVDNDGKIRNGIAFGEIREVNVKLQKYEDMYGSASLKMQIMGDSNEYINGSKITLYSGWDATEDATPVMVAADDISKIYAYRYNGGWMEIQTTPGCYTVKIEKVGYETEYRNVLIHESMYPYIVRMHKAEEPELKTNLVISLKDQLGNPYVNYNVVMSKYVNGHFQYWYGLPTDSKGRRVVNTDLPEGQYRLHVYDENDSKIGDIDIVWDKSKAELVDDGFLPNKYYNIEVQLERKVAVLPDDVYFENGMFNSKYVGESFDFNSCGIIRGKFYDVYWGIVYGDAKEYIDAGQGFQALGTNAEPWVIENGELARKQSVLGTDDENTSKIYLPIHLNPEEIAQHGAWLNITMQLSGFHGEYEDGIHNRFCYIKNPDIGRIDALETGYIGPCAETDGYVNARRYLVPDEENLTDFISFSIESYEEVRIKKIWITNAK